MSLAETVMWKPSAGLVVLGIFLMLVAALIGFFWLGMQTSGGMGSMNEAERLRPIVEGITGPDDQTGEAGHWAIRFPNGEWVAGVAKDSHALYAQWTGGGTVVLKDSRGRVRCFFGHVCGNCNLYVDTFRLQSLDEFDAQFTAKFAEQKWP